MNKLFRYAMQAFNYALFMGLVWYFSTKPAYRRLQPEEAVITITLAHAAKLRSACRTRTAEELAKLAPNMRLALDCPRERSPITLALLLNGDPIYEIVAEPPGIYQDQGVDIFRRIKVDAGQYLLTVWMNDDVNTQGATFRFERMVTLIPEQQLLVEFNPTAGGFSFD